MAVDPGSPARMSDIEAFPQDRQAQEANRTGFWRI